MKVFISTAPFAEIDQTPLAILDRAGVAYTINPAQRRLTSAELCKFIYDVDGIIAGTEEISASVMQRAPNLKIISRVGIGLDSVDLNAARRRGIMVTYTPDAPSPAVAELTIGLILSSLRGIHNSHRDLCAGKWKRYFGTRLTESSIGIIGVGRIGGRVVEALKGMGCHRILVNDLDDRVKKTNLEGYEWVEKEEIYRNADVISLHVPLTRDTRGMIARDELQMMSRNAVLVNTSRGGIVDENDLLEALKAGRIRGAALDTFESEPYSGPLKEMANCLLTSHLGSMTIDCRAQMEIQATADMVGFLANGSVRSCVPETEYNIQGDFSA